jgi:UDP-N-acetylglucosamine--N-acetylmuramyl-(pentapeptide) pyrophosphoryl-undecaprenol N-acetylglucosamine transferase
VLVIGGSLGAITLNQNVPAAVGLARSKGVKLRVIHQSGRGREQEVIDQYNRAGARDEVEVVPFIDDVPSAIARADVVVQRSGASAVSELCAIGRATVLIPYPYAAANHQLHNARALEAAGAAVCVPSLEATPQRLTAILEDLAHSPEKRSNMAKAAAARGKPDAGNTIARDLLDLPGVH